VTHNLTESVWEFRELSFSRESGLEETRELLTFKAERGRWELDRTRIYRDGRKKIRLRRKIIRVAKGVSPGCVA
jgi:hypothetical protein